MKIKLKMKQKIHKYNKTAQLQRAYTEKSTKLGGEYTDKTSIFAHLTHTVFYISMYISGFGSV